MKPEKFFTLFPPIIFWEELKDMGTASKLKGNQHASMHDALIKEAKFSSLTKNSLSGLAFWRLHVIDLFQSLLGTNIYGNVLEIGSGK